MPLTVSPLHSMECPLPKSRQHMDKLIAWWGKGIFVSLCFSIVLLGTGTLDLSLPGAGGARVERFPDDVFHVADLETVDWGPLRRSQLGFHKHAVPIPLLLFFDICHDILISGLFSRGLETIVIFSLD